MPVWASAAIAGVLGLLGYAVGNAGAYALTQRLDPTLQTVVRNRYILGGLIVVGGLLLAKKKPLIGAGLAAGGAAALAGTQLSLALGNVIDMKTTAPTTTTTTAPTTQKGMGAVFANNMRGYARAMGAVYGQTMRGYQRAMGAMSPAMGAVYGQNMMGMGNLPNPTGAPWHEPGPFGYGGH
jgi:hypothetical protein